MPAVTPTTTRLPAALARPRPGRGLLVVLVALATTVAGLPFGMAGAAAATSDPTTGASIPGLPSDAIVLHVDINNWNPEEVTGTADAPIPTIYWGVSHARQLRQAGHAVHVKVAPGVYREDVTIRAAGDNPPMVVEATEPGTVVVTGADVEEAWTRVAGTDRYTAPWAHQWGLSPIPAGWEGVRVPDAVRRREMVLVDGQPLRQVVTEDALEAGTFLVDETAGQLVVEPGPEVADLADHHVEVATRDRALHVNYGASNVTVRGLTFEATATPLAGYMAYVSDASDILIEDNTFRHSSWGGFGVCCTDGITIRGNRAVDNGGNGIDTHKTSNALIEGNTMRRNNVRGAHNGFVGWSVAGAKHMYLQQAVLRDNVYEGNYTRGLWFDTNVVDVLVDGDRSCANGRDGLFIEAVEGPLTIEDSTFCDNPGGGILVGTSGGVALRRTQLTNNGVGQLVFSGARERSWTDHRTGEHVTMGDFADWTIVDSTFTSGDSTPLVTSPVIPMAEWESLLAAGEITASGNTWQRSPLEGAIQVQGVAFPMADWNALTGDGVVSTDPEPAAQPGKGNGRDKDGSGPPSGKGGPHR